MIVLVNETLLVFLVVKLRLESYVKNLMNLKAVTVHKNMPESEQPLTIELIYDQDA